MKGVFFFYTLLTPEQKTCMLFTSAEPFCFFLRNISFFCIVPKRLAQHCCLLISRKIASRTAAKSFKNEIVLFIFGFASVRNIAILLKEINLPLFLVSLPCSYRKLTPFGHLLLFLLTAYVPCQLYCRSYGLILGFKVKSLAENQYGKRQYTRKR